ncbi:chaplin [Streptomyces sp. NPDC046821]|uniref:chaplin n=1 Tax=Streptomyces sp. NPDC046821 TaxID=3154702 RepID=UPI00340E9B46
MRIRTFIAAAALGAATIIAGAGVASADGEANGFAADSPGVLSGNVIQVPIHVPLNLCGNTVDILGALNPTMGNQCANNG